MAVPKNKRSKSNRNTKRNSFKLNVLSIVECPRCRAKKVAHRVCKECGYYDNKEIIKIEQKSKEKSKEKVKETKETKPVKTKQATIKEEKTEPAEQLSQNDAKSS